MLKYVVRRGKELIKEAFIATGNEENEYGKAMVPRQAPFRSSSSDVMQSTCRCNVDYQYQKRAVPDLQTKAEAEYQYQMRAEAEYQRKMTAETENQCQRHSAGACCYRAKAKRSVPEHQRILLVLLRCS